MTIAQISAIIALLTAFNVPIPTVAEVENILLGTRTKTVEMVGNIGGVPVEELKIEETKKEIKVPLVIKAELGLTNKQGIVYGGNCAVVVFNTNQEVEFRGETGISFTYKPQATSTIERLVFTPTSDRNVFVYELEVAESLITSRNIRPYDETRLIEGGVGIYVDPVTGRCL